MQGARLDALGNAVKHMGDDGKRFVRPLQDLIAEFMKIKKQLIHHETVDTISISRQVRLQEERD